MLAAGMSTGQGTAIRLDVPDEPGLVAVEAVWRGQTVPLASNGDWFTVLGIDLDDAVGGRLRGKTGRGERQHEHAQHQWIAFHFRSLLRRTEGAAAIAICHLRISPAVRGFSRIGQDANSLRNCLKIHWRAKISG